MTSSPNTKFLEQRIEYYEDWLSQLNEEALAYEFNDYMGCDYDGNFTPPEYLGPCSKREAMINHLLDNYAEYLTRGDDNV